MLSKKSEIEEHGRKKESALIQTEHQAHNPFNVTPDLKQAAIIQKPETENSTAPPPPPPKSLFRDSSFHSNHKNPSEAPKRKKPRTQIVDYLGDDNDAQGKQKRRARLKKFRAQPYKYSKGELRR